MADTGSQTRLQRLQRQRQRANQRHARAASSVSASVSTVAPLTTTSTAYAAVSNNSSTVGVVNASSVAVKTIPPSHQAANNNYSAGRKTPVVASNRMNNSSRPTMLPNKNQGTRMDSTATAVSNANAKAKVEEDETSASSFSSATSLKIQDSWMTCCDDPLLSSPSPLSSSMNKTRIQDSSSKPLSLSRSSTTSTLSYTNRTTTSNANAAYSNSTTNIHRVIESDTDDDDGSVEIVVVTDNFMDPAARRKYGAPSPSPQTPTLARTTTTNLPVPVSKSALRLANAKPKPKPPPKRRSSSYSSSLAKGTKDAVTIPPVSPPRISTPKVNISFKNNNNNKASLSLPASPKSKSLAVSKSIAQSPHYSRYGRGERSGSISSSSSSNDKSSGVGGASTPKKIDCIKSPSLLPLPPLSKSKPARLSKPVSSSPTVVLPSSSGSGKESWFQYTNGTTTTNASTQRDNNGNNNGRYTTVGNKGEVVNSTNYTDSSFVKSSGQKKKDDYDSSNGGTQRNNNNMWKDMPRTTAPYKNNFNPGASNIYLSKSTSKSTSVSTPASSSRVNTNQKQTTVPSSPPSWASSSSRKVETTLGRAGRGSNSIYSSNCSNRQQQTSPLSNIVHKSYSNNVGIQHHTMPSKSVGNRTTTTTTTNYNNNNNNNNNNNKEATKPKLPSNPAREKDIAVVGSSSSNSTKKPITRNNNKSIVSTTIRHNHAHAGGGTPIWIHTTILDKSHLTTAREEEQISCSSSASSLWEWTRGHLHATTGNSSAVGGNTNTTSMMNMMSITINDPYKSDMDGITFTISKEYNDGVHILMGNSWWSSPPANNNNSPSPTSVIAGVGPLLLNDNTNNNNHNTDTRQQQGNMPPGDLVELTHLHGPAIVSALRSRYEQDRIYTYTGAILLALNPFKKLDWLYTREMMELYWNSTAQDAADEVGGGGGQQKDCNKKKDNLPPHAYAVAERAYSSMICSLEECDHAERLGLLGHGSSSSKKKDVTTPINQSILVSGESGAGKTVTTKIVMRYLSILSQRHNNNNSAYKREDETNAAHNNGGNNNRPSVEMQVLQSNPVLESFGNARTIRNDNSSRFGKFIEMSFQASSSSSSSSQTRQSGGGGRQQQQQQQQRGSLLGATIDFYLLEKVRLVSVNPGERNYHIFYEVLSPQGMSIAEKQRYMLSSYFGRGNTPSTVHDFNMTSVSGTFDRRDGVDDSVTYGELRTAMDTVGFCPEEQDGIFSVVSALLHASNLQFVNNDGSSDNCLVCDSDGTSDAVSHLLGVSEDSLKMALTTSVLEARGEILMKRLSPNQAEKALEATVKATYGALFTYIVARINKSIEVQGAGERMDNGPQDSCATIGVLDIFGFESFENNSLEQLHINFCNEALQQQFNRFVFKAEQAEYEYEGIEWSNIEFPDNQEALDLIEVKRVGIFAVLDEQCRLPRRTDQTFAKAIYDTCESNKHFAASQMQQSQCKFSIVHYAGEVEYDSDSFLLKNKDELPKSAADLLASSTIPLISELACILHDNDESTNSAPTGHSGGHAPMKRSPSTLARATVSGQFASQLKDLRSRIATTEPHYIRCLKPNDRLIANHYDESLIAHQLNCAGVIPAMKIARTGFAMRYAHEAFVQRYRPIVCQELNHRSRNVGGCQHLISLLADRLENELKQRSQSNAKMNDIVDIVSWGVQVGKTKVFLRTVAFDVLEELRNSTMNKAATVLQAQARAFLCQNKFYLILGSVLTLQCAARKLIASVRVNRLRSQRSSTIIQKQWRSYFVWYHYQNTVYVALWCQRFWRGRKFRAGFVQFKQHCSAVVIQSAWRSHVFQQCHRQMRSAAITIQCIFRVGVASKNLKQLKREAKNVQSIAMERDRLRMEMRQMKRELDLVRSQKHDNSIDCSDSWTTARTSASQEEKIRNLSQACAKKDQELQLLRREVDSLRGSGKSVPSTLPLTVTVDTTLPPNGQARYSPLDLSLLPSGESSLSKSSGIPPGSPKRPIGISLIPSTESSVIKSIGFLPTSPSLLDSEVEGLPPLESSQISLPGSSMDMTDDRSYDRVNFSSLNHTAESSFLDCMKIDELPFHQAVQSNDREMLLEEIQNSSDIELSINSADSKGRTPLHIAAQCSHVELAKILLSHDAVANTQDFSGNTALHYSNEPEMTSILLDGGINANIPNGDGLCSLHMAVKKRDFVSAKHLLLHGADVNNADDEYWYTPLHLVAHAESPNANTPRSLRGPIAELLCEAKVPSVPDLNYQDRDGNSPLHHAASLAEEDAGILISLFIEHGSSPKIANHRGQTPIHLFCHNHAARQFVFYHEALHLMLVKGADPNATSLSGCTALHLALYHNDVEAAALLSRAGAQLNVKWKKPQKWDASWTDMGDDVLPLDMLEDPQSLSRVLAEISTPQSPAPHRIRCMHCKVKFGMFARKNNCTHCGRSICGKCCVGSLRRSYFPTLESGEGNNGMCKVCSLCEPILLSKVDMVPSTIISGGGCDQSSIGTISM